MDDFIVSFPCRVIFGKLLGFPSVSTFLKCSFCSMSQCFARIFCHPHILEI